MPVLILARDACITWKKKLCPLDLLAPILGVASGAFESMRFSRHPIDRRVISTYTSSP
jgi:hypothetical protein